MSRRCRAEGGVDFGGVTDNSEIRLSRSELIEAAGIDADLLEQIENHGLCARRPGTTHYDGDALVVAQTIAEMRAYGLEPRHLRAFRTAAEREAGLVEQVVAPLLRQRDPEARARAEEVAREMAALSVRLHTALVRTALRGFVQTLTAARVVWPSVNELDVVGVRVEMPSNQPIVLLKESDGERYLPIWIGAVEATAIAYAQQGVVPPRPLTHDLIRDLLKAIGQELTQVRITSLQDGVFYADLVFASGLEVSARPSDAIAHRPADRLPDLRGRGGARRGRDPDPGREQEDEVEKFREFLDGISPEDFGPAQA